MRYGDASTDDATRPASPLGPDTPSLSYTDGVPASPQRPAPERPAPLEPEDRVLELDVLRGFALFGILVVNIPYYGTPLQLDASGIEWWPGPIDRVAKVLVQFLAQGKFYPLFATLFGVGLALQHARATERGAVVRPLLARRLGLLLVIGALHAFLVWHGDILMLYALVGLALLLLLGCSRETLLAATAGGLLLPLLLAAGSVAVFETAERADPGFERALLDEAPLYAEEVATARAVYSGSSFTAMLHQRARDVATLYEYAIPLFAPGLLALFSIGALLVHERFFDDPRGNGVFLRRALPGLLAVGLAGTTLHVVADAIAPRPTLPSRLFLLAEIGQTFGGPALGLTYAAMLMLLMQTPRWRPRLALLAPAGRMALTGYLTQSLVCTTLFNGYGLGLYGKVAPAAGLLLALGIFAVQVPLCHWWLARFRFGPAEWLWRSLTYGRACPMRLV